MISTKIKAETIAVMILDINPRITIRRNVNNLIGKKLIEKLTNALIFQTEILNSTHLK